MAYDPPDGSYTSAIPPGTAALRRTLASHWQIVRTEVIRDRGRCQQQRSEHCECRAIDFFVTGPRGREIFDWAVANHDLGLQSVIFDRRVWGFGDPTERAYTRDNPHTDHVHIGVTRDGSMHIRDEHVRKRLGGPMDIQQAHDSLKGGLDYLRDQIDQRYRETVARIDRLEAAGVDYDKIAEKVAKLLGAKLGA